MGINPFSTWVKQVDLSLKLILSTPAPNLDLLRLAIQAEEASERPGRRRSTLNYCSWTREGEGEMRARGFIDYITVLDIRMEVLIKIDSIRRVFLWVAGWAWRHLHSSRS
jgi:hypothetical protein